MAGIEGIRIRGYRALGDITLGKLWNTQQADPLTPITAVIGSNGVGKSSLFDAFGFLADCLKLGVEEACDAQGRGGFFRIRSQGRTRPIEFALYYREHARARPITYEVAIDADEFGRPFVRGERLRQRRRRQRVGRPFSFLMLNRGRGQVWKGEALAEAPDGADDFDLDAPGHAEGPLADEETAEREDVEISDTRVLGIATLGTLRQHPRIAAFRSFVEGWYLSYFTPDAARSLPLAGPQSRLSKHGDNLGNVVQFMERDEPGRFEMVLERIAACVPGITSISTDLSPDGRLLLQFNDRGFSDPFYAQQVSDGTLKLFAYLLMLEDPHPPPFICVEEPENGLYHKLLEILAGELRAHATAPGGPQVFVTTHQPYFVDALTPEETWVLDKGKDGFSTIRRASDDPIVRELVAEGLGLGGLWYSEYLDSR